MKLDKKEKIQHLEFVSESLYSSHLRNPQFFRLKKVKKVPMYHVVLSCGEMNPR